MKVELIGGFLGAGKTTLIKGLIEGWSGKEKLAVLVNEFGEVGIDGALLAGRGGAPSLEPLLLGLRLVLAILFSLPLPKCRPLICHVLLRIGLSDVVPLTSSVAAWEGDARQPPGSCTRPQRERDPL